MNEDDALMALIDLVSWFDVPRICNGNVWLISGDAEEAVKQAREVISKATGIPIEKEGLRP